MRALICSRQLSQLYADARREHKSFLSQYTEDGSLTEPQIENTAALLGDLNRGMAHAIGVSREYAVRMRHSLSCAECPLQDTPR